MEEIKKTGGLIRRLVPGETIKCKFTGIEITNESLQTIKIRVQLGSETNTKRETDEEIKQ